MPTIPSPGPVQNTPYGMMSPGEAGAPGAALEQAGRQEEQLAQFGQQVAQTVQRAQDHVATLKFENQFNADLGNLADNHRLDTDWETMQERVQKEAEDLRKKYEGSYSANPRIWPAIQNHIDSRLQQFHEVMFVKHLQLMQQDNLVELDKSLEQAHQDSAQTEDPSQKEIIKNEAVGKVLASQANGLLTKVEGYKLLEDYDIKDEKTEVINGMRKNDPKEILRLMDKIDSGHFKALQGRDPEWLASKRQELNSWMDTLSEKTQKRVDELTVNGAIGELQASWTLPDGTLDFAAARKQLASPEFQKKARLVDENGNPNRVQIEQVETYLKGFEGKENEVKKQAHDKFEKDIGNLYLKGNYPGLLKALGNPDSPLTGDETRTWTNSVRERQGQIKDENKDVREAGAIIQANDMIRKGEDPGKVRAFIIRNLTEKGDREQYINKLDNKLSQGIEEGRKQGYADIKDIIFPPARAAGMSVEAMIQSPLQTMAIKVAQMELDDWIAKQIKAGKEDLTVNNIRAKAHELADAHAPRAKDTLEELNREIQEFTRSMGGGAK